MASFFYFLVAISSVGEYLLESFFATPEVSGGTKARRRHKGTEKAQRHGEGTKDFLVNLFFSSNRK
jgi:hypothetical protein